MNSRGMSVWFCCRIAIALICLSMFGCSPKHPGTYEGLSKAYESAHKSKNIGKVNDLIYWGAMPANEQKRILDGIEDSFEKSFFAGEIAELPDDFEMTSGAFTYPFKPGKEFKVKYEKSGNKGAVLVGMVFTLGVKDDKAYILYRSEDKK